MYRHNGRRRMDRKIDCSVSGNGVFSNVIGSWRSAYPVSFVVPGAPQTAPLHTPPSEADESIVLTMFSAEASPTPCVWDNPLRSCTRCSRADDVIRTPTGSSCVRSSCPSLRASITPPASPSPRFTHISIKRIGGGLSNLHSNSYMFYTPLTVQHPAFSYLQLISSMMQGNGAPHSRACMPYSTHNPECGRETIHGWIYDNACSWPGLPSKEQAYGSAQLIRLPFPGELYSRHPGSLWGSDFQV